MRSGFGVLATVASLLCVSSCAGKDTASTCKALIVLGDAVARGLDVEVPAAVSQTMSAQCDDAARQIDTYNRMHPLNPIQFP
jgi:hypothetical protein